jgi:S1-C subfamily serine protease
MKPSTLCVFAIAFILTCATFTYAQTSQSTSSKLEAPVIYEKAAPSIVLITCVDTADRVSQGSGVILRPDGVIATNYHVISDAVSARIQLNNGDVYDDVSVIDTDERKDIAILKVKAIHLPALTLADSDSAKIGATVYVIGAPRGLTGSLSSGIISSLRLASEVSPNLSGFRVIQFTAPISPGSSGSPLIDEFGRLLGLAFATRVDGQNINLAVPVNYVAPLAEHAKNEGRSLKRMPSLETLESKLESGSGTINDIGGTYTGTWASGSFGYGILVMTVSIVNGEVQGRVVLTGSDVLNEDTFDAKLTSMGTGVWKMDFKCKKANVTGTGVFKNGKFAGDYHFKKGRRVDRGKWILQKN